MISYSQQLKSNLSIVLTSLDSLGQLQSVTAYIPVKALPPAVLLTDSIFPKDSSGAILTTSSLTVQIRARYIQLNTPLSEFSITMRTPKNNTRNLTMLSAIQMTTECSEIVCSLYQLSFLLPSKGNPDGDNITETVDIMSFISGQVLGSAKFKYISALEPSIDAISPSSQSVTESSLTPITVFGRNFPKSSCSRNICTNQIASISAIFGQNNGTIQSFKFTGEVISIICFAPIVNQSGQMIVTITASVFQGQLSTLKFPFTFFIPPADIIPVDGSTKGNTKAIITAFGWGSIVNSIASLGKTAIFVKIGDSLALINRILLAQSNATTSIIKIEIRTPASSSGFSDEIRCIVGTNLAAINSTFTWRYYQPASIMSISPSQATVGGYTDSGDGNSALISVRGFPIIYSSGDVAVSFNSPVANHSLKSVVNMVTFADEFSILNVTVPIMQQLVNYRSTVSVTISRFGAETRSATFFPFSYFVPTPTIQSFFWCQQCNMGSVCLVNGKCKNEQNPSVSRAALLQGGVLTLVLQNWYNASLSSVVSPPISIVFLQGRNLNASSSKISSIYATYGAFSTIGMEFILPNISKPEQCLGAVLQISTDFRIAMTGFECVDRTFLAVCKAWKSLNDTACAGPSMQGESNFSFVARIYGQFTTRGVGSVLAVTFGNVPARENHIASISTLNNYVDLLILPPDFGSSQIATSINQVDLIISDPDNKNSASIIWTFWSAPKVLQSYFDPLGTMIIVVFDQATNRGGMIPGNVNCSLLFNAPSVQSFGRYPVEDVACIWAAEQSQLTVILGASAYIVPNMFLTLLPNTIKSTNEFSNAMNSTRFQVNRPKLTMSPRVTLVGPSVIDPCSPLAMYASGNSARDLYFRWSCLNDQVLNETLANLSPNPTIEFPAGTPDMKEVDKTYNISVIASDFLGSFSKPVFIQILKKGNACPSLTFWPATFNVLSNQPIYLSGSAQFSSCPVPTDQLNFSWYHLSGPSIRDDVRALISTWSSPQAYLPAYSLQPGGTYTFLLRVQTNRDPSKMSEATVNVIVGTLPIFAIISGGSTVQRYQFSSWMLDASASLDLDRLPNAQNLTYNWHCAISYGISSSSCLNSSGMNMLFPNKPILLVESGALAPASAAPYIFSVTVYDASGTKFPGYAQVSVFIIPLPLPSIDIELISGYKLRGSTPVINSNDKLILRTSCSGQVSWTVQPDVTYKPNSPAFPVGFSKKYFILIGGFNLLAKGVRYTFTASCFDQTGEGSAFASMTVDVNEPPSSGYCTACVLGRRGCQIFGVAISTIFRTACLNWADQDNPILYRFGLSTDKNPVSWFAPSTHSFVDLVLPAGSIQIYVEVVDSLGASTGAITVTSLRPLSVGDGTASPARKLLQSGQIDWSAAIGQLGGLISTKNSKDFNSRVISIAYEINTEFQKGILNFSISQTLTQNLLSQAQTAFSFVPKLRENVCAYYVIVQNLVQSPEILNTASLRIAAEGLRSGVSDRTYLQTLGSDCLFSAVTVISNILVSTSLLSLPEKQNQENYLISVNSDTMSSLAVLYSVSLTIEEGPLVITSNAFVVSISVTDTAGLARDLKLVFNNSLLGTKENSGWFSLPDSVRDLNKSQSSWTILEKITKYAPFAGPSIVQQSPWLGLSLFSAGNIAPVQVQNLTEEIIVVLPLNNMSEDIWNMFKQQIACAYWDGDKGTFQNFGVRLVSFNRSFATCASKHLTDFAIVQNLSTIMNSPLSFSTTTKLGVSSNQTVSTPSFSGYESRLTTTSLFNMIIAAVGDDAGQASQSWNIASMNWIPYSISSSDFEKAVLKLFLQTGNVSNSSVTLIVVPGFVMKTVAGFSYSKFRVAVKTSAPSTVISFNTSGQVSSIVTFTEVQNSVPVVLIGLRFKSTRRNSCSNDLEYRYTKVGENPLFSCKCPANSDCNTATNCTVIPSEGDQWYVVSVPRTLCLSSVPTALSPTPVPGTSTANQNDSSTSLGLGIGLGIGVPVFLLLLSAFYYANKGASSEDKELTDTRPIVPPTNSSVPVSQAETELPLLQKPPFANMTVAEQFEPIVFNSQLVFSSSQPAVPASEFSGGFETTTFSLEPPLQLTNYWDLPYMQHQQVESPDMPFMPTYNPYDLADPSTRRFQI